MHKKYLATLFH